MQCSFVENEATQVEEMRIDDRQNSVLDKIDNLHAHFTNYKHNSWELTVEQLEQVRIMSNYIEALL